MIKIEFDFPALVRKDESELSVLKSQNLLMSLLCCDS